MPVFTIALWFGIFVHASLLEYLKTFSKVALGLNLLTPKGIMELYQEKTASFSDFSKQLATLTQVT